MPVQRFRVGQNVEVVPVLPARYSPSGDYKILRRLQDVKGEAYYRVKSLQELHGRVVKESLLRGLESS